MKNICYIFGLYLLISVMMSSCGNDLSDLEQITANTLKCEVNQKRANYYYEKYGKNNSQISASDALKQKAFQSLSNVPEKYLEFVIGKHKTPMSLGEGQYGGGVTYLQYYGNNNMYPTSLQSDLWALPHEFGHASEGSLWEQYPSSFTSDLANISALIAQKYQSTVSAYLRSYAGSYQWSRDRETFAELFDTWYCSEEARNRVKEGMPEVYAFAQKYLLPPEGESKDINVIFYSKNGTSRLYFGNNNNYSNISYCISTSSSQECSEKNSVSSFSNKSGKSTLFVSKNLDLANTSSFTVFVYGDDSLVRKVSISK